MKTTKTIFEKVVGLYNQIVVAPIVDELGSMAKKCDEYNDLVGKWSIDNEIFTGEKGLEGVKWCWGGVMIPAEYDKVEYMTRAGVPVEAVYVIARRDKKSYLLDHTASVLLEAESIRPVNGIINPVIFSRGGKWGIAFGSRIVLDAEYDEVVAGSNGFYFLTIGNKHGFMDPWGKVIRPIYESIGVDDDDYLTVSLDGQKGYVDEEGNFTPDRSEAYYNLNMGL